MEENKKNQGFSMWRYLKGDRVIWIMVILLMILSAIEVFSSTAMLSYNKQNGNTVFYFVKHVSLLVFGLIVMIWASNITYKFYFKFAWPLMILSWVLLLYALFFGEATNGATRWLKIPIIGIDFQVSDLAKLALVFFLARFLSEKRDTQQEKKLDYINCLWVTVLTCALILPTNLSTTLLILMVAGCMLIIGNTPKKYLLIAVGVLVVVGVFFIAIASLAGNNSRVETWKNRLTSFVTGESNKKGYSGKDFQAEQARIAVARGGLLGQGPGHSRQRNQLPHSYSDFIYSIICEEFGMVGGVFVLLMFIVLSYRCIPIVKKLERTYPAYIAIGVTLNIIVQALAHMYVDVNLGPVTGQPLPLVSMGGSSVVITSFEFGLLLNISRYAEKREEVTVIENSEEEVVVPDYPLYIAG